MNEYKKPYVVLFNAITDALVQIDCLEIIKAKNILIKAQLEAEEEFIKFEETKK